MKSIINGMVRGIENVVFFVLGVWAYSVLRDIKENVFIYGLEYVDWTGTVLSADAWDKETCLIMATIALITAIGVIGIEKIKERRIASRNAP